MRLCMLLEAQFGSNIAPIERPKLPSLSLATKKEGSTRTSTPAIKPEPDRSETPASVATSITQKEEQENGVNEEFTEAEIEEMEADELDRLHSLGIPVPGVEIKVDKHIARVWLETLDVECTYPVLRDRVKIVVERAVETVAGLWAQPTSSYGLGKNGHMGVFGDEMDVTS
jgi:cleavage and polyadenylation specificity factor subunit 3